MATAWSLPALRYAQSSSGEARLLRRLLINLSCWKQGTYLGPNNGLN